MFSYINCWNYSKYKVFVNRNRKSHIHPIKSKIIIGENIIDNRTLSKKKMVEWKHTQYNEKAKKRSMNKLMLNIEV